VNPRVAPSTVSQTVAVHLAFLDIVIAWPASSERRDPIARPVHAERESACVTARFEGLNRPIAVTHGLEMTRYSVTCSVCFIQQSLALTISRPPMAFASRASLRPNDLCSQPAAAAAAAAAGWDPGAAELPVKLQKQFFRSARSSAAPCAPFAAKRSPVLAM